MRFWYASRAEVVVSETFNFMEVRALPKSPSDHSSPHTDS